MRRSELRAHAFDHQMGRISTLDVDTIEKNVNHMKAQEQVPTKTSEVRVRREQVCYLVFIL